MAYHSQTKCSDNLPAKTPVPKAPVRLVDEVSSDEESADEVPGCFQLHLNSIKEAPRPIKVVVWSSSRNGGRYWGCSDHIVRVCLSTASEKC